MRGIDILKSIFINCGIDILKRENLFEQIINQERNLPKQRLLRVLSGPLNIDSVVIPEIHKRLADSAAKIIF